MQVTTGQETESRLPTPAAYYRPARAKALRQQAARLAWWERRGRLACLLAAPTASVFAAALFMDGLGPPVMMLAVCGLLLASATPRSLAHWSARLEAEANALDREHETRHGVASAEER